MTSHIGAVPTQNWRTIVLEVLQRSRWHALKKPHVRVRPGESDFRPAIRRRIFNYEGGNCTIMPFLICSSSMPDEPLKNSLKKRLLINWIFLFSIQQKKYHHLYKFFEKHWQHKRLWIFTWNFYSTSLYLLQWSWNNSIPPL